MAYTGTDGVKVMPLVCLKDRYLQICFLVINFVKF